jgi:hypothetical protein
MTVISVRTFAVALTGMLLVASLAATSSPASAATTDASVSAPNGVRYAGCHNYRYSYSIETGGYFTWDAVVRFLGPSGQRVGTDYLYDGTDNASGKSTELICDDDPVGVYDIVLEVTFYDEDGNEVDTAESADSFRLRKPRTRTSFTVTDRTPAYYQFLTFRIVSKIEGPRGYVPNRYEDVVVEARRAGGWKRIFGSRGTTNRRGVVSLRARWERRKPLAIRAATVRTKVFDKSVSHAKILG